MGYLEQQKIMRNSEQLVVYNDDTFIYIFLKRIFDLFFAIIGFFILLPVFAVVSGFYLFGENRGPMFFSQQRIGKNGKPFKILKFRTMVVNAEEKLKTDRVLYKKFIKNGYKLETEEDPRITRFGRFLRKTSIDELPQLLNVIKGEMSLVGPRPVVEEELAEYKERRSDFLSVKPGVTGYWQVSGRSNVNYPERVDIELYYVRHKSVLFDMKILLKTFTAVIFQRGAY
ncbi:sugar transferase [Bacillaceae bacterium Marseille-Q3522]|nr:sugar transferase [Bacillaceae bacterium Marseille-Q3522]